MTYNFNIEETHQHILLQSESIDNKEKCSHRLNRDFKSHGTGYGNTHDLEKEHHSVIHGRYCRLHLGGILHLHQNSPSKHPPNHSSPSEIRNRYSDTPGDHIIAAADEAVDENCSTN